MDFIKIYTIVPEDTLVEFARVANNPDTINQICQRFRMNKAFIICPRTKPYYYIVNLNNTRAEDGDKNFNLLMSNARYYSRPAGQGYFVVQFYLTSAPIGFNDQRPYYLETNKNRMQAILDFPLTGANSLQYTSIVAYWTQAFNGQRYALYRAGQHIVTPLNEIVPYQGVQQYLSNLTPSSWNGPPTCYQSNTSENIIESTSGVFAWNSSVNRLFTIKAGAWSPITEFMLFYMVNPDFQRVETSWIQSNVLEPGSISNFINNFINEVDNPTFLAADFTVRDWPYRKMISGSTITNDVLGYFGEIAPNESNIQFKYAPVKRPIGVFRYIPNLGYQIAGYLESFAWNVNDRFQQGILNPLRQDTIIPIENFQWPSNRYQDVKSILRMGDGNICRDLRLETLHDINRVECFTFNLDQYSPYVSLILSGVRYVRAAGEDPDFPGYNEKNPIGTLLTEGTTITEQLLGPPTVDQDLVIINSNAAKYRTELNDFRLYAEPCDNIEAKIFNFVDKMYFTYNQFSRPNPTTAVYSHYVQQPLNKWLAKNYSFDTFPDFVAPTVNQTARLIELPASPMRFWAQEAVTTPQNNVSIMIDYDRFMPNEIAKPAYILPKFQSPTPPVRYWNNEQIHYVGYRSNTALPWQSLKRLTDPPYLQTSLSVVTNPFYNKTNRETLITSVPSFGQMRPAYNNVQYVVLNPWNGQVGGSLSWLPQVPESNSNVDHYLIEIDLKNKNFFNNWQGTSSFLLDWDNVRAFSFSGPYTTQVGQNWQGNFPNGTANGVNQVINYAILEATGSTVMFWRKGGIKAVDAAAGNKTCYLGAADYLSFPDYENKGGRLVIWWPISRGAIGNSQGGLQSKFRVKNLVAITKQSLCNGYTYDTISYTDYANFQRFMRFSADGPINCQYDFSATPSLLPNVTSNFCSTIKKYAPAFGSPVLYSTLWNTIPMPTFEIDLAKYQSSGVQAIGNASWDFCCFNQVSGEIHDYYLNDVMQSRTTNAASLQISRWYAVLGLNFDAPTRSTTPISIISNSNCVWSQITINVLPQYLNTVTSGRIYWQYDDEFNAKYTTVLAATFSRSFSYTSYPFVETQRSGGIYFYKPVDLRVRQTITPGTNWLVHVVKVTQEVLVQIDDQPPQYVYMRSLVESLPYADSYNLRDYGEDHYLEYEVDGIVDFAPDLIPLRFEDIRAIVDFTYKAGRTINRIPIIYCNSIYTANGMNLNKTTDCGTLGGVTPTIGQPFPFISLPWSNVSTSVIRYQIPANAFQISWKNGDQSRWSFNLPPNPLLTVNGTPRVGNDTVFNINFSQLRLVVSFYGLNAAGNITEIKSANGADITSYETNQYYRYWYPPTQTTDNGGYEVILNNPNTVSLIVIWEGFQSAPFKNQFTNFIDLTIRQIPWFYGPETYSIFGRNEQYQGFACLQSPSAVAQNNTTGISTIYRNDNVFRGTDMFNTELIDPVTKTPYVPFGLLYQTTEIWRGIAKLNATYPSTIAKISLRSYINLQERDPFTNIPTLKLENNLSQALTSQENQDGKMVISRQFDAADLKGTYFNIEINEVANDNNYMVAFSQLHYDAENGTFTTPEASILMSFSNRPNAAFSETPWPFLGTNAPQFPRYYTIDWPYFDRGETRLWVPLTSALSNILLLNQTFTFAVFQSRDDVLAINGNGQSKNISWIILKNNPSNTNISFNVDFQGTQYITFTIPIQLEGDYRLVVLINNSLQFNLANWTQAYLTTTVVNGQYFAPGYGARIALQPNYLFTSKGITNTDFSNQIFDTTDDAFMYDLLVENKANNIDIRFEQPVNEGPMGPAGINIVIQTILYKSDNSELPVVVRNQTQSSSNRVYTLVTSTLNIPSGYDRAYVKFSCQNILTRDSTCKPWNMVMTYGVTVQNCTLLVCNSGGLVLRQYTQCDALTDNPMSNTAVVFPGVNLDAKLIMYMNSQQVEHLQQPLYAQWSINGNNAITFPSGSQFTVPSISVPAYDGDYNNAMLETQMAGYVIPQLYCPLFGEGICSNSCRITQRNPTNLTTRDVRIAIDSADQLGNTMITNKLAINFNTGSFVAEGNKDSTFIPPNYSSTNLSTKYYFYYKLYGLSLSNFINVPARRDFTRAQFTVIPTITKGFIQSVTEPSFTLTDQTKFNQYWIMPAGSLGTVQNVTKYKIILASYFNTCKFYLQTVTNLDYINNTVDNLWLRTWDPYSIIQEYPAVVNGVERYVYEIFPVPTGNRLVIDFDQGVAGPFTVLFAPVTPNSDLSNYYQSQTVPYNTSPTIFINLVMSTQPTLFNPITETIADPINNQIIMKKIQMPDALGPVGRLQIYAYAVSIITGNKTQFGGTPLIPFPYPDEIPITLNALPGSTYQIYFDIVFENFNKGFPRADLKPVEWVLLWRNLNSGPGKAGWAISDFAQGQNISYTLPPSIVTSNYVSYLLQWSNTYIGNVRIKAFIGDADDTFEEIGLTFYSSIPGVDPIIRNTTGSVNSVYLDFDLRGIWDLTKNWVFAFEMLFEEPQVQVRAVAESKFVSDPNFTIYDAIDNYVEVSTPLTAQSWPFWVNVLLQHPNAEFFIKLDLLLYGGKRDYIWPQFKYISAVAAKRGDHAKISNQLVLCDAVDNYGYEGASWHLLYSRYNGEEHALWRKFVKKTIAGFLVSFNPLEVQWENSNDAPIWDLNLTRYLTLYFK